jgi:hypothetical protein
VAPCRPYLRSIPPTSWTGGTWSPRVPLGWWTPPVPTRCGDPFARRRGIARGTLVVAHSPRTSVALLTAGTSYCARDQLARRVLPSLSRPGSATAPARGPLARSPSARVLRTRTRGAATGLNQWRRPNCCGRTTANWPSRGFRNPECRPERHRREHSSRPSGSDPRPLPGERAQPCPAEAASATPHPPDACRSVTVTARSIGCSSSVRAAARESGG